jgi:hypothetical protein
MAQASPAYLRITVVASGALSLVGVLAAVWVYLKFAHPTVVEHSGRWSDSAESIESYLFSYPALQVATFVIAAVQLLRWRTVQQRMIERESVVRTNNPRLQRLDSILLYKVTCLLVIFFEVGLLGFGIHSAWAVTTNGI